MTHCPDVQGLYYLIPFKRSESFDRFIGGLIKAGLKVDSIDYYKVNKENKMTGKEINEELFGKTIRGKRFGEMWSLKINNNGKSEKTWPSPGQKKFTVHIGNAWIEGNMLCQQYNTLYRKLKDCAEVYRNPHGDKKTLSQYILWTDYWLYPISVEN